MTLALNVTTSVNISLSMTSSWIIWQRLTIGLEDAALTVGIANKAREVSGSTTQKMCSFVRQHCELCRTTYQKMRR